MHSADQALASTPIRNGTRSTWIETLRSGVRLVDLSIGT